jgi:hypothetical protein
MTVDERSSLSIGANVIATIISFVVLMIAPTLCLQLLFDLIDAQEIGPVLMPATLIEALLVAMGGSLLFLIIAVVLQLWQRHKRFASWWPMALAFPTAWALILPEPLVRGGSVRFWIIAATLLATAFCLHWLALLAAREAMD